MKGLFDTSVLIPALIESNPAHEKTFIWLTRVRHKEIEGVVCSHALSELYAYLTGHAKKSPASAMQVIEQSIASRMEIISLSETEYLAMLKHCASLGISGAAVYDALHACTAIKTNADVIFTSNKMDFYRVYPELRAKIFCPLTDQWDDFNTRKP